MRKPAIVLLLVLAPVFLFFWYNLQVSHKYKVNHPRTFVEINSELTLQQKKEQFKEIDALEKEINSHSRWMLLLASASFALAILLAYLPLIRKNTAL